jgi:hypothetical protein
LAYLWLRRIRPASRGALPAHQQHSSAPSQLALSGRMRKLTAATIGLPGYAELYATRAGLLSPIVELVVRYASDGSTAASQTVRCAAGGSATIGEVEFGWQP